MHWELRDITVWHLERLVPLQGAQLARPYELVNLVNPDPAFCRYLYATVGAPWLWYEKIGWSLAEWRHHVNQAAVQFWVGISTQPLAPHGSGMKKLVGHWRSGGITLTKPRSSFGSLIWQAIPWATLRLNTPAIVLLKSACLD